VTGNAKANFDGNILKVAPNAEPGKITVTVTVQGHSGITAQRTLDILPSSGHSAGGSSGVSHTVGIKADGSLWAWGYNLYGQLGNGASGSGANKNTPTAIAVGQRWVSVSAGGSHTMGIKTDGSLWAWGNNNYGQLGNGAHGAGTIKNTPTAIAAGQRWVSVSAGGGHTMGIKPDGSLWAWGSNSTGQFGDGTTSGWYEPVATAFGQTWTSVSAGSWHTVGIKPDGSLWAWGSNKQGQLGDGTKVDKSRPTAIAVGEKWRPIVSDQ
ncbi:MAG: hypothetical protein FWD94_07600, partial [Treponema sp.]|nr:hypothetical protein [Treponema sp.]